MISSARLSTATTFCHRHTASSIRRGSKALDLALRFEIEWAADSGSGRGIASRIKREEQREKKRSREEGRQHRGGLHSLASVAAVGL
jgi:hypothetical protein